MIYRSWFLYTTRILEERTMTPLKDIRIEVKVRNNLVLSRMEEKGIGSVSELCRQIDETREDGQAKVHQSNLGMLINMKDSARKSNGEWSDLALRLSAFFHCMPEDLFSDPQQWNKLEKNRTHAEVTYTEIQQLTARNSEPVTPELALQAKQFRGAIAQALRTLTPREERILRMRFGFETGEETTLQAVAETFGLTRERIREIEAKALRKLKHPSRSKLILAAAGKGVRKRKDWRGKEVVDVVFDTEAFKII